MTRYHYYDLSTGLFIGECISSSNADAAFMEANARDGCGLIAGVVDLMSQRVDLASGVIVDYVPPRPSDDHDWNTETKRWLLRPEIAERNREREQALRDIAFLEGQALRPQREILLSRVAGLEPAPATVLRLEAIEAEIESLRAIVRRD